MKKQKVFILLLSLVMVLSMVTSVQAASKKKAFASYLKWIETGCKDENGKKHSFNKFYLVKVDSDKIPELVACKALPPSYGGMEDICVVSYKKKKVVKLSARTGVAGAGGFRGAFSYIPKKGRLRIWSMSSGNGSEHNVIYKLKKDGFKKYATADFSHSFSVKKMKFAWSYTWNGKKVSKKTLKKKLAKAFKGKNAKHFTDLPFVSKSEIIAMLK